VTAPDYKLRVAVRADLTDVFRLVRGLAEYERLTDRFTIEPVEFEALLFGPRHVLNAILAEVPGRAPVGVAVWLPTVSTFSGRWGMFLEDLFVEPDMRGAGIGRALLRELARIAVERDYYVMEWRVLNWNKPAIEFYEHLGAMPMASWHVRQLREPALHALAEGASTDG
jgi:GNAT superfamily N-acetyltransferase